MKKNTVVGGVVGLVVGVIFTLIIIWNIAPGIMMVQSQSKLSFEETVQTIQDVAKANHWVVPNVMRLDNSLKKHGYDVLPVAVIELCNADLSSKVLKDDDARIVTSLMPCRVSVYQKSNGDVMLSRMNTGLMSKMFGPLVTEVMSAATEQTEKFFSPLEK